MEDRLYVKKNILYKYKLKNRHKPFLGGRENPSMHRSGQPLFQPHAKWK